MEVWTGVLKKKEKDPLVAARSSKDKGLGKPKTKAKGFGKRKGKAKGLGKLNFINKANLNNLGEKTLAQKVEEAA